MEFNLRRICALILVVAVIFAGMGVSHAAGSKVGEQGHHAAISHNAGAHDDGHHASTAQQKNECHDKWEFSDKVPSSKHGDKGGCCHSAFSPSIAVRDIFGVAKIAFDAEHLVPHIERIANSFTAETPLRPPRAMA